MEQIMEYVPNDVCNILGIGTAAGGNYSGTGDKRGLQFPFYWNCNWRIILRKHFSAGIRFEKSVLHIFEDGLVGVLSDPYNVGILIFLVVLWHHGQHDEQGRRFGMAFGQWAGRHIKTRIGCTAFSGSAGMLILLTIILTV